MKKLIGIGIAAMMLMGLAGSANAAYLFNLLVQNPENSLQKGSVQFATNTTSATPWTNPAGINPQVVGFAGNDPASTSLLTAYKNTVEPCSWYAKVFAANGYVGVYDVRVTSSSGSTMLSPGTWYMYKGIGICNEITHTMGGPVTLMATGVMKTTETTWALSTFGSTQFAAGDYITMSRCPLVPEPGSMVAMLSGLIGLAGFSIRRRK